jgi:hypothetical protein
MATENFLVDFHIHSTFSDGKLTIPELVDLYGREGFGAIAITDHIAENNTLIGKAAVALGQVLTEAMYPIYLEMIRSEAERAWREYRMLLFPGFELSKNTIRNSRSAHIVAVGVEEFLSADGCVSALCSRVRQGGGITIAAHPVNSRVLEKQTYYLWDRREELTPHFDAWEVASGRVLFPEVQAARIPKIASSDLHQPAQIESWKTLLQCERHPQAILAAIRKQEVDFRYFRPKNVSFPIPPARNAFVPLSA